MSNIECNITEAKSILKKLVKSNLTNYFDKKGKKPVAIMLYSPPGVGKSAITKQITDEIVAEEFLGIKEFGLVDLRLGALEQAEVCGIPYVSHAGAETEEMKFSIPQWFPTPEKVAAGIIPEVGIVFLDELTNASIGAQHGAYRIVLDNSIQDGVVLAPGWMIVGAGNRREDKTGAKAMVPAMANRFAVHLSIYPDVGSFVSHAANNGFRAEVIGFLHSKPDAIYDAKNALTNAAFASPRSWEFASDLLDVGFSGHELVLSLSGCVGSGLAADLMTHMEYYTALPNWDKVRKGAETFAVESNNRHLSIAVASSLVPLLVSVVRIEDMKEREFQFGNLRKVMETLDDEFLALIYRSLIGAAGGDQQAAIDILYSTMDCYSRISKYATK